MQSAAQPQDENLLALFAEEKTREQAFTSIIQKYQHDIYNNIRRVVFLHEDAVDVMQNVFIKMWRHLGDFRGDSSLKTWIVRICVNESLTFIKKKKELCNLNDDSYTNFMLKTAAEEKYFSSDKIESLMQHAIAILPEKQRIVFSYRYFDEMPYEEMSKILDTSVGALKASYHFAYQKVVEYIKKNS
ncbi:MAG: sigma-70 family RNA polymerase sigma factor [Bacteroidales bacterium]|nr:sigma-70 family RNA polymerase sigma factor [Bacteroidales bacterium]